MILVFNICFSFIIINYSILNVFLANHYRSYILYIWRWEVASKLWAEICCLTCHCDIPPVVLHDFFFLCHLIFINDIKAVINSVIEANGTMVTILWNWFHWRWFAHIQLNLSFIHNFKNIMKGFFTVWIGWQRYEKYCKSVFYLHKKDCTAEISFFYWNGSW